MEYIVVDNNLIVYLDEMSVAIVTTYPPRECGIATYSKDLVDNVSKFYVKPPVVLAINDSNCYDYDRVVGFQINRERVESYIEAADYINDSDIDVVNIQHEFGLFGGTWGENVITFLEKVEKPIITTLHTVLQKPAQDARRVLKGILQNSDSIIVMAKVGIKILKELYDALAFKIRYIPHGCPDVPFVRSDAVKPRLGLEDSVVLSTFGLLSRGKGIEYVIKALPQIVKDEPRLRYFIIGETHPEVRKHEGEEYRRWLIELVKSLGLEDNVIFVNRFLPKNELIKLLQATDIYILPYPNREQISSGTLLYALSTGKAIVTTPFLHAEEVITDGCAVGCEFKNPCSIVNRVKELLQNIDLRRRLEKRAYEYSRSMTWSDVAMKHVDLFYNIFTQYTERKIPGMVPVLKVPSYANMSNILYERTRTPSVHRR